MQVGSSRLSLEFPYLDTVSLKSFNQTRAMSRSLRISKSNRFKYFAPWKISMHLTMYMMCETSNVNDNLPQSLAYSCHHIYRSDCVDIL